MNNHAFIYQDAFSRNIGLISEEEQQVLQNSTAAIAGMGGMGGAHALTLARLGIGNFIMADFDHFEVVNFNRQVGATVHTIGSSKLQTMAERVREINPEAKVTLFPSAITQDNAADFLEEADILLDGLDFFSLAERRHLFYTARSKGIFVVSAGPIGFSAILQVYDPLGMDFDQYYAIHDRMTFEEMMISFLVGIAPGGTHLKYIDKNKVDLGKGKGPSLGLAVQMAAGLSAAQVAKILIKRGPVRSIPYYFQVDAFTLECKQGKLWLGNRNPIQKIKIQYVKHLLQKAS